MAPGLRPTPDRVRETLFNWLAPIIGGSRCLDCFAGSGALGFEAASRGAARVVMLERAAPLVATLRANRERLGAADLIDVHCTDVLDWLGRAPAGAASADNRAADAAPPAIGDRHAPPPAANADTPFDLAFLDPPYASALLGPALARLATGWLSPGALVYLETAVDLALPALPPGWAIHRDKTAGAVRYALARTPG